MPLNTLSQIQPLISQEEVLAFLLDPQSYPHRPNRVRLIQTHTAYVILASPYVYKMKKPVNFGFLDFTTLEKRRYFSEREVVLNRRLCPMLYLGVVPIFLHGKHLRFEEGEHIVEYTIKMWKLSDRYFLNRLLERGEVGPEEISRLVVTLKAFYERQTPTEEVTAWGRVEKLKLSTDENFRQTRAYINQTLTRPAFEAIQFYTNRFYDHHTSLFDARVQAGWIRDCHGDLHLEHIHLSPTSLCIYDCIEFNDRFRSVDIANDVAFLAMDLDYNGRPDLARLFVTRMADALHDPLMLQLMDFYKCYRAYVRGKVESFRSSEQEVPEPERQKSRDHAQRYFRLALQYAVSGSQPVVLAVMGRIGSGKSTLARRLASELGWPVFSSDHLRKTLAGLPLYTRSAEAVRRWLYSETMTMKTYEALFHNAEQCVQEGRGLVLDATFARRALRDWLRERLERTGTPCYFIEATAHEELLKRRLLEREQKADEASDARLEDFDAINQFYESPDELSASQCLSVTTAEPLEETLIDVLKGLASLHLRINQVDSYKVSLPPTELARD